MARKSRRLNKDYSRKLKAIRSFVKFDYDLRKPLHSSQKAKINKYYDAINSVQARPNKVYRSKNKKRLRMAQGFGRNGFENLPDINVAFYESTPANPVTLRFDKKNRLTAKGEYFDIRYVPFNQRGLLKNADKEIARALADPANKGAKWYRVAVGENGQYSIAAPRSKSLVPRFVKELMNRYGDTTANNYWGNWLHGLLPMTVKNQSTLGEFLVKETKYREKIKQTRKRQRRNAKGKRVR